MWVRFTPRRLDYVEHYSPGWLCDELAIEQVQISKLVIDVRAPAIAWRIVRDLIYDRIYGPYGGWREEVPTAVAGALREVATRLGEVERHPALRGIAMLGYHAEYFPVWSQERDDRDRIWSIYPNEGSFAVLRPEWMKIGGRKFTTWSSERGLAPEDRLTEEEVHLRILREVL